ncbi:hypothetical protein F4803DRAFT_85695 [Xylaria telfairii]|nr:hypothetical protein F4803DRAFT_85695 [Xylaria telfairii]
MDESLRNAVKTCDDSAHEYPDSNTACPTRNTSSEQGEGDGKVGESQDSSGPISNDDKPHQSTAELLSWMTIEMMLEELIVWGFKRPRPGQEHISYVEMEQEFTRRLESMPGNTPAKTSRLSELPEEQAGSGDKEVSLRGGGLDDDDDDDDDDDEWPYNNEDTPTRPQRHVRFAEPEPTTFTEDNNSLSFPQSPASVLVRKNNNTLNYPPPRVVFPGMMAAIAASDPFASTTSKRKASDLAAAAAASNFQMLPLNMQRRALSYLRGDAATGWAHDVGLPLMDMFQQLRACVLLLCEDENPALARDVLRDADAYARFRDGLNPNFLAPDDEFVRSVRAENACLDARLKDPYQRWKIVLAFRTVDFPALAETGDGAADGAGEDTPEEDMGGGKENVLPREIGLGDLDMST